MTSAELEAENLRSIRIYESVCHNVRETLQQYMGKEFNPYILNLAWEHHKQLRVERITRIDCIIHVGNSKDGYYRTDGATNSDLIKLIAHIENDLNPF